MYLPVLVLEPLKNACYRRGLLGSVLPGVFRLVPVSRVT